MGDYQDRYRFWIFQPSVENRILRNSGQPSLRSARRDCWVCRRTHQSGYCPAEARQEHKTARLHRIRDGRVWFGEQAIPVVTIGLERGQKLEADFGEFVYEIDCFTKFHSLPPVSQPRSGTTPVTSMKLSLKRISSHVVMLPIWVIVLPACDLVKDCSV